MSLEIEMPQLSADGESATLASWLVEVGQVVEQGEVIAELETDKSTLELESPASGTIQELLVAAGTEDIGPGTLLGRMDTDAAEEDHSATEESGPAAPPEPAATVPATAPAPAPAPLPDATAKEGAGDAASSSASVVDAAATSDPRRSTPLARRAAAAAGVDVTRVEGTGPRGRVIEADIQRLSTGADLADGKSEASQTGTEPVVEDLRGSELTHSVSAEEGFTLQRLSAMRKTIARRMSESKRDVPHFYLRMRCPMDAVMAARARLNAGLAEEGRDSKISINDFIVRAAALALRAVPLANVQFSGNEMRVFDRIDLSVAVATDGGLVTPIVRDADRKGLVELADEIKALALAAREGSLRPDQYQGGTATLSNLGMYGIETVYPIVNPPQSCIFGVGAAEATPIVRDGNVVVGHVASFTLAADHRVVDGAVGAQLLAALRERLEDPMSMVL